jgi:glutamyl-tRNA synthetase
MDQQGGRLSKRTGAVAVSDYKKNGFLSEAIVNYLLLLGWSPGNSQEIIALKSAVKSFSIKKVNKTAAAFSMDKLKWINNQYLKTKPTSEVTELLLPILKEKGLINGNYDSQLLERGVELYKGRLSTLLDFCDWADFLFTDDFAVDEEAKEKYAVNNYHKEFDLLADKLNKLAEFNERSAEGALKEVAAELGKETKDLVHPIRVALTGKSIGPSLFGIMDILGKETVMARLKKGSH